jgi:hypothetical protein
MATDNFFTEHPEVTRYILEHERRQPLTIPMEDPIIHTDEHPYCVDPTCPCGGPRAYYAQLARRYPIDDDTCFGNPEQDETGTHPPDCRCAWCEPQERNTTQQCSDGSWW